LIIFESSNNDIYAKKQSALGDFILDTLKDADTMQHFGGEDGGADSAK